MTYLCFLLMVPFIIAGFLWECAVLGFKTGRVFFGMVYK